MSAGEVWLVVGIFVWVAFLLVNGHRSGKRTQARIDALFAEAREKKRREETAHLVTYDEDDGEPRFGWGGEVR